MSMDFARTACAFGSLGLSVVLVSGACFAAEKSSFSVTVTKAISVTPKEAGSKTVEVDAVIAIKNEEDRVIGVSPRQLRYELRKKHADGTLGESHRFFGIAEPELKDALPLAPGQTAKLKADLEGHTIGVDIGSKYVLVVMNPNDDDAEQQVEVTFK